MKPLKIAQLLIALCLAWGMAEIVVAERALAEETGAEEASPQEELAEWNAIKATDDADAYLAYLNKYPDGMFFDPAKARYEDLSGKTFVADAPEEAVEDEPVKQAEEAPPPKPRKKKVVVSDDDAGDVKRIKKVPAPKVVRKRVKPRVIVEQFEDDPPVRLKKRIVKRKQVRRVKDEGRVVKVAKRVDPVVRKRKAPVIAKRRGCFTNDGEPVACRKLAVAKKRKPIFVGEGGGGRRSDGGNNGGGGGGNNGGGGGGDNGGGGGNNGGGGGGGDNGGGGGGGWGD